MHSKKNHQTNFGFYHLSLIVLFLLAIILRFYHFDNRWFVDFDPARDAMVAREAINLKKIPPIGAFSSAGPFVWGPLYYWEIMLAYLIAPNTIYAPWILYGLMDLLFIFIMIKIGQLAWGNLGGFILGLITTISTGQLLRSTLVNQPTLIPLFGALVILNLILYLKSKNLIYLFAMGLATGLALNNHFQFLNYGLFILILLVEERKKWVNIFRGGILYILGVIIPLIPLFYWDSQRGWKNINNVMDFFLIAQYRFWVSNRWLLYAGKFWPQLWTNIIGGKLWLGYVLMFGSIFLLFYGLLTKKLPKNTLWLAIIFGMMVFVNRYYRGERFEGYMLYFYPFVMYFSAYTLITLYKTKKLLGIILLSAVIIFTIKADIKLIREQLQTDQVRTVIRNLVNEIKYKLPGEKFRIYDLQYINPTPSMVTSFMMSFQDMIDENKGKRLGFGCLDLPYPKLATVSAIVKTTWIYDLTNYWDKPKFQQDKWINVSPKYVSLDIMEWWKVKKFNSTFCLFCFIKEKLTGKI